MGPRLSTLYDASARGRVQSPVTDANTDDVQQPVTHGYRGSRAAWVSASRRHVALIDTIRGKTSRPRRAPSKPTVAAGDQAHHHGPAAWRSHRGHVMSHRGPGPSSRPRRDGCWVLRRAAGSYRGQAHHHGPTAPAVGSSDKRVWTKLISRLSRKMGATRLTSSSRSAAAQQVPDTGVELHQGPGGGAGLIRGTSSVLPVSRNPVTTTVAYNDYSKRRRNDNNNVLAADDIASRVSRACFAGFCYSRHDIILYTQSWISFDRFKTVHVPRRYEICSLAADVNLLDRCSCFGACRLSFLLRV